MTLPPVSTAAPLRQPCRSERMTAPEYRALWVMCARFGELRLRMRCAACWCYKPKPEGEK